MRFHSDIHPLLEVLSYKQTYKVTGNPPLIDNTSLQTPIFSKVSSFFSIEAFSALNPVQLWLATKFWDKHAKYG